jgi:sodium/potassium/calcium exchanger 6
MSEALGGVTLIALGNGAGDVVTAIVASGAPGGVSYNIGALFGAGLFVIAPVICITIHSSAHEIKVDRNVLIRDAGFYLLGSLMVLGFGIWGEITWWGAIMLLVLYFVLVVVVYV